MTRRNNSNRGLLTDDLPPETVKELHAATDEALIPAASMFERLAKDASVPVEKLEKLIELQERIMRHNAKAAFDAAFSQMQAEIPEVTEKGRIEVKGNLRSTYAKLEDIHKAILPILKAHGFAIRHRTEWPADRQGIIRIVGILSHEQGHSEESSFEAPADKSDYRTDIQSMGSTVSYGRRYTTLDLLNIVTRGQDDDGQSSGRPEPPKGYDEWVNDLTAAAQSGQYEQAWGKSNPAFRTFMVTHDKATWAGLKPKAVKS